MQMWLGLRLGQFEEFLRERQHTVQPQADPGQREL